MQKKLSFLTVASFCLLLFGFALAFPILPDQPFSEQENRSLRTLPAWSVDALLSGRLGEDFNAYFADQFPLRDALVGVKGMTELALGKGENNGVLLGKNGQLATRLFDGGLPGAEVDLDGFDPAHVRASAEGLKRTNAHLSVPFSALLTGRTLDIAASAFAYPSEISDALQQTLGDALRGEDFCVETIPLLREKYDAGEYVYYRTDHHWTTLGAYYAYVEVMKHFGMEGEIIPADVFRRQTVSTRFFGTAWSAGGMKQVAPDSMEIWTLGNEADFSVTADGRALDGFYNRAYLEKKDQYSLFLDGTHDVVTVTKQTGEARPRLLILKDSFANSLAPFLAQHFDLVLLNLSSTRKDFCDLSHHAAHYAADRVLLVYTLENVMTADKLTRLR